ncbi:MAG: hypothetical protein K8T89_14900 [Planctomycetes bacterium]|nr:hypothetical protein [Planctomycetota bacterium]
MSGYPPNPAGRSEAGAVEIFAEQLRVIAQARGRASRSQAIDDLADAVLAANAVVPFLKRLFDTDRHGQRLALEIASRLPLPLVEPVNRLLLPLMSDSRFPLTLRMNVGAAILRSVPDDSVLAGELLAATIKDLNPYRAAERLRTFQQRFPDHPRINAMIRELDERSAIPCPRCGVRLQRSDLIVHLWNSHRLLMDGKLARDPWRMIEDWLGEYAKTGRKDLLERCCELGQQLDPEAGLTRVHRLLLTAGLTDEEAKENLESQAEGRRASLCPHCYALVPQTREPMPPPLGLAHGRFVSHGYKVEVSDRYLFTHLNVRVPNKVLYNGTEPRRGMTRRGSVLAQLGPLTFLAFFLAVFLPVRTLPPLTPVALVLLAAFLLYLRMRIHRGNLDDPSERAIEQAWRFVVPELHQPNFSLEDSEFLGSLALASIGRGSPELRENQVERMGKLAQPELVNGLIPPGHLAALRCLEIDDAIRLGRDPVPLVVNELAHCLADELPLSFGEQILETWPSEIRDRGQRSRLRVLLAARAFELGFEPRDLQELGRISESYGLALASEDLNGLARLRWLWDTRTERPWRVNGPATTVFDLARYRSLGGQYLEARPDLLLFQTMSIGDGQDAGAPILICEEGVVYRDIVLKDPATPISYRKRTDDEFELVIGKQKLLFNRSPALLAQRLQGWLRFLFEVILPATRDYLHTRSPGILEPLTRQKVLRCPECGNSFLALRGEVGILTDV